MKKIRKGGSENLSQISGPVRTCLGCRTRRSAEELARLVLDKREEPAKVVWDRDRRLPGRGAWVCADDPVCLTRATSKNRLAKALRVGEVDVTSLTEMTERSTDKPPTPPAPPGGRPDGSNRLEESNPASSTQGHRCQRDG
ncbi:MAG: YlxR family protein [Deltaproteobacteria bacterium]|nr:YlxR family protein [Deltaproteobacteria bacterium]